MQLAILHTVQTSIINIWQACDQGAYSMAIGTLASDERSDQVQLV